MPNPITLPIFEALDYLHARNLIIARLWTTQPRVGPPQTHAATKPRPTKPVQAPIIPKSQQFRPTCVICHKPKDDPAHATYLSVPCLEVYFGKK